MVTPCPQSTAQRQSRPRRWGRRRGRRPPLRRRTRTPWRPPTGPASRPTAAADRKSTRLNSSHVKISYAVFCLKKKKKKRTYTSTQQQTAHEVIAQRAINGPSKDDGHVHNDRQRVHPQEDQPRPKMTGEESHQT